MLQQYKKVLLFDVETTGLDFNESDVIEFGYVVLENGKKVEDGTLLLNWFLVNDQFVLPQEIQAITNISKELLYSDGITPVEAVKKIKELINDTELLICHNQAFDYNMVKALITKVDTYDVNESVDYLDTLLVVGDSKPWSNECRYTLTDSCKRYNISLENAHRAIDDILATWQLVKAFHNDGIDLEKYINKWGYYSKYTQMDDLRKYTPLKVDLWPISWGKNKVK